MPDAHPHPLMGQEDGKGWDVIARLQLVRTFLTQLREKSAPDQRTHPRATQRSTLPASSKSDSISSDAESSPLGYPVHRAKCISEWPARRLACFRINSSRVRDAPPLVVTRGRVVSLFDLRCRIEQRVDQGMLHRPLDPMLMRSGRSRLGRRWRDKPHIAFRRAGRWPLLLAALPFVFTRSTSVAMSAGLSC